MATRNRIDADWLTCADTQAVMGALDAVEPGCARFVGGCVRNTLRGAPVDDIDIATQLVPEQTIAALKAAGIRSIATGLEHGTITAIVNGTPYEITTLRRDVETDGRRAVVAFTREWAEDAARRDFRLNAIYADAMGTLYEPIAHSIEDAVAGRVIFIGDADERLREDFLRILRFFRFNAWYGHDVDAYGLAACERQKDGLSKIAAERIWKEFKKMLAAPDPSAAIAAMQTSGVLDILVPGGVADRLPALVEMETGLMRPLDPLVRVMSLLPRSQAHLEAFCQQMRVSNEEHRRLTGWIDAGLGHLLHLSQRSARPDLHSVLYTHGKRAVCDRVILDGVATKADVRVVSYVCSLAERWKRPQFPIGGDDALAAGLRGPEVGKALRRVETLWIESQFLLKRKALLELLKDRDSQPIPRH